MVVCKSHKYQTRRPQRWRPLAWVALVAMLANPALLMAQTQPSGGDLLAPGDNLTLAVPGRPELSQRFVLDENGQAIVDPVGAIQLGGLTREAAMAVLKQKLRLFHPTLDTLHLDVARSDDIQIYILGRVGNPGVLSFSETPSLWSVVRRSGGPLDDANLHEARVIREVGGTPEVHPVDLSGIMEGGALPFFPMHDGDTVVIPALQEGIPGVGAEVGVKVFGGVGVPTIVPIDQGTPLMDVLMLAGAPTATAEKSKIHWVHNDGVRNQATVIDLEKYLLTGDETGNPLVYPGDTISVEFAKPSWVRQNIPFILGSLAAMATIYLAMDTINNRNTVVVR